MTRLFEFETEDVKESFELQEKLVKLVLKFKQQIFLFFSIFLLYGYVAWLYYYFTYHGIEVFIYAYQLIWILVALHLVLGLMVGYAIGIRKH